QNLGYNYYRKTHFNSILNIVPQQEAWVVERFGRFFKVLSPGLQILVPFVDQISYIHSLKEVAVNIAEQTAITMGIWYLLIKTMSHLPLMGFYSTKSLI
ncbi:hypothetical protein MXB_1932, partial [Myxobolus squamalis]